MRSRAESKQLTGFHCLLTACIDLYFHRVLDTWAKLRAILTLIARYSVTGESTQNFGNPSSIFKIACYVALQKS